MRTSTSSLIALALLSGACSSMNSQQGTLQAVQDSVTGAPTSGTAAHPYVEAFVEMTGPHSRWSGPATLTLHLVAREPGDAKITLAPELFASSPAPTTLKPADAPRMPATVASISSETARQQLAQLATALAGGDETFSGCVTPVRVRLIRQDGAVLDKQGCRSQTGWARSAGELVSTWIANGPGRSH